MDELEREILELLKGSRAGMSMLDLCRTIRTANTGQLAGALTQLEAFDQVVLESSGRWVATRRPPTELPGGLTGYLDQRTRRGGVLTTEGFIPYYPHPSGWLLPVKIDAQGRPRRRNRRLVYALPDGGEYQPHDQRSLDHRMRERG